MAVYLTSNIIILYSFGRLMNLVD